MNRKWDRRFLELAKHVAQWSKDPSTKVGAVLVDKNKVVVGTGYNGFPRGVEDTEERLQNREMKYKLVVHAEANAIYVAGDKARGASLYVWPAFALPDICHECCKAAIQAGVREVIASLSTPENAERAKRWNDSILIAKLMCDEAGLEYRMIDEVV